MLFPNLHTLEEAIRYQDMFLMQKDEAAPGTPET
jgi:hypothetical protein